MQINIQINASITLRHNLIFVPAPSVDNTASDRGENNHSKSVYLKYTNERKALIILFYEKSGLSVSKFISQYHLGYKFKTYLSKGKDGQKYSLTRSKTLQTASDNKYKYCQQSTKRY